MSISEKLSQIDEQMNRIKPHISEFKAELAKEVPEITSNGEVIATGEEARTMLQVAVDLHDTLEAMAADARKTFGH